MKNIIIERSNLIMEYIGQILLDNIKVSGTIILDNKLIDDNEMITIDIFVKERNFERHFNSGIKCSDNYLLNSQILKDLINNYKNYKIIKLGYMSYDNKNIIITNNINSIVTLNFWNMDNNKEDIDAYNKKIKEINYEVK